MRYVVLTGRLAAGLSSRTCLRDESGCSRCLRMGAVKGWGGLRGCGW